jgi:hypothetical protein
MISCASKRRFLGVIVQPSAKVNAEKAWEVQKWNFWNSFVKLILTNFSYPLRQGSQTRGPRAACGSPDALVRPANTSKNDKSIRKVWSNLAYFEGFSCILRPARVFLINCGPRSIFTLECGPPTNLSLRPLLYVIRNQPKCKP